MNLNIKHYHKCYRSNAEIYSTLPCPNGCSLSAGRFANLNPIIVITEDAVSERLLNPSAVMDTLEVINPTIIFVIAKAKLDIIPTIPARFPYLFLTCPFSISSLFFIELFIKKLEAFQFSLESILTLCFNYSIIYILIFILFLEFIR